MPASLPPGRFLGTALRTVDHGDLRLIDIRYSAGAAPHAHERPYFCLIRRGRYTERLGSRRRECRPMTLAWHPPGTHHAITLESPGIRALNVELGPEWLGWMLDQGYATDQPALVRGGLCAAAALRLALAVEGGGDRVAVESLAAEVVAGICGPRPGAGDRRPRWLGELPDLLGEDPGREPSLRGLAEAAGVHPVHFAAVFRRFHGCSLGDYLRRRRVGLARRLAADPDRSLAEVAAAAGFADQSHLTRAFKRFTGLTPGRYRTLLAFKTA